MKHPVFNLYPILFLFVLVLSFSSCKKDNDADEGGTEIADVRTDGALKTIALNFTPGSETVTAITLQNVSQETSNDIHVRLAPDNAAVTAAKLMPLPANAYTLTTLEYDVPADGSITVPMVINRSNLTVDTTYGIGFTIAEVSEGTIAADAKSIVVKITLRNRFDGIYAVTGTMTDVTDATYGHIDQDVRLITTSPTQVKMVPIKLGIEGQLIKIGSNTSFYSSFGPVFNFNASNHITSITNFYGQPAANTRAAELDPSGDNTWNAFNKNIAVKFWMNQPGVVAGHRSSFNNNLTFIRER